MKITIETDYVIATVESKPLFTSAGDNSEIDQAVELFKCALAGVGFGESTISEALPE